MLLYDRYGGMVLIKMREAGTGSIQGLFTPHIESGDFYKTSQGLECIAKLYFDACKTDHQIHTYVPVSLIELPTVLDSLTKELIEEKAFFDVVATPKEWNRFMPLQLYTEYYMKFSLRKEIATNTFRIIPYDIKIHDENGTELINLNGQVCHKRYGIGGFHQHDFYDVEKPKDAYSLQTLDVIGTFKPEPLALLANESPFLLESTEIRNVLDDLLRNLCEEERLNRKWTQGLILGTRHLINAQNTLQPHVEATTLLSMKRDNNSGLQDLYDFVFEVEQDTYHAYLMGHVHMCGY